MLILIIALFLKRKNIKTKNLLYLEIMEEIERNS